ncbi:MULTISPECIES: hypothetical protein [unclassified Brevibacterium]|uniref:hypothetical protein n=1 Tax=unclassified Brevibacterium TaxID=2614124 RepID=UPI001E3A7256|nr:MULTISPECIES: hypothetical protein [unclassified Brevibacterium]MCD1287072.1 hypothetical protein [Brevibacterium sp. CCUG 69071]MDK8436301.1 hypothetical protein [Brevibacterium sp. H-BE7]
MYNVVRTSELRSHGSNSRLISHAIGCCLLKLTYGMYSIIRRCGRSEHRPIAALISDEAWIAMVREETDKSGRRSYRLLDTIEKLRVASYPHYWPDDVVWGSSAAFIHELPLYRPPRGRVRIANPSRRGASRDITRTTRPIPEEDVVRIGKMALTSPIRTGFDLVGQLGEAEGFAALESCLRLRVFGSAKAADHAARVGYAPDTARLAQGVVEQDFAPVLDRLTKGRKRAAHLASIIGPFSESYAESRCSYNLRLLKLTGFEQQVDIVDAGRTIARVDFLHRETKTIVMVDGVTKYADNGFPLMQKEALQTNRLIAMGYRIVRLTFADATRLEDCATRLFGQVPQLRGFQIR